jgi:acyl-CoA thioesterase
MDWRKRIKNWKLICFVAALFAVFGDAAPHVEPLPAVYGPTTVSVLQVSGAQTPNTFSHTVSFNADSWVTK